MKSVQQLEGGHVWWTGIGGILLVMLALCGPLVSPVVAGQSGSIAASPFHACSVASDGAMSCWGYNGFGQLGDGTTQTRLTPVSVSGLETYLLVANTSTSPADVRVRLFFEDGGTAEDSYRDIPANSRFNVPVGVFFPQADGRRFASIVESLGTEPAQIVVERAVYWNAAGQRWAAGTSALGTKLR